MNSVVNNVDTDSGISSNSGAFAAASANRRLSVDRSGSMSVDANVPMRSTTSTIPGPVGPPDTASTNKMPNCRPLSCTRRTGAVAFRFPVTIDESIATRRASSDARSKPGARSFPGQRFDISDGIETSPIVGGPQFAILSTLANRKSSDFGALSKLEI